MVKQNWQSQSNRETFKDLLIFEERLKQNAERLQSQRKKYQGKPSSDIAHTNQDIDAKTRDNEQRS